MADTEPTRTVTLTATEVQALRDAMDIAFSEYETIREARGMIDAFPSIRAKLDTAQGIAEDAQ